MLKKFMEINMITLKLIILILIQKLRSSAANVLISLFNGQVVILNREGVKNVRLYIIQNYIIILNNNL